MGWHGPMTDRQYRTWAAWFAMQDAAAGAEPQKGPPSPQDVEATKSRWRKRGARPVN